MSSSGVDKEKRGSGATVKACDSCRRRKRKCAWSPGATACVPCLSANESCSTTHVRKPRAKSQKRTNRIAEYESRIQRLESLLRERSAAQPHLEQQPLQRADENIPLSNWVANLRDELDSWPIQNVPQSSAIVDIDAGFEGFDALEDDFDPTFASESDPSLVQTSPENSVNTLAASTESIPYIIPSAQVEANLAPEPVPERPLMQITHEQPPLPKPRCDAYMPPPELGTSLLKEFLVDFNTAVPLYRPHVIAEHLRVCYMGGSDGTAVAWAATYVVFGIAHRLRAMSAAASPQDNEQADYFLGRLLASVPNLLLQKPSLGQIQCLLGLATLIQTSSLATPHASFISTALRMAQCLAYNDHRCPMTEPELDVEQERRVFWIAFLMDTEESIVSNAPTSQRRENIAASRPEDQPADAAGAITAAEGTWGVNIFSLRAQLALLQAEAIEKILSVRTQVSTPEATYMTARYVLQNLHNWRKHEVFQLQAEQLEQLLYRSDLVHILGVEASYFATVFRIQSFLTLDMNTRLNPFSTEALARLVEQKDHSHYKDAKRFLSLLAVAPQGDIGVCWMIKQHVVAALCTVLAQALHNPSVDVVSRPEMREYSRILQTLTTMAQKNPEVQNARDLCMSLLAQVDTLQRVRQMQNMSIQEQGPMQVEEVIFS